MNSKAKNPCSCHDCVQFGFSKHPTTHRERLDEHGKALDKLGDKAMEAFEEVACNDSKTK